MWTTPINSGFRLLLMLSVTATHAADMPGSSDHPTIPRVTGAEIHGYEHSEYDAGNFLATDVDEKVIVKHPEGTRIRILYLAKPGDKPLMVQKNYESALNDLGAVTEVYNCKDQACDANKMVSTLWSRDSMIPTEGFNHPFYLLGFSHNITLPSYHYVKVDTDDSRLHVGVFASLIAANNSNKAVRGTTAVLVEIIETKAFEPTLEFVDAAEMQNQFADTGHVALYGIQFDHDKASLRAESKTTLDEIATLLNSEKSLKLYVVGHTDDVGALTYNQDLSLRRATTVVDALVADGIDRARLTPLGAGPAAPVGNNDTEEGRALNRRVELVKRKSGK